MTSTRSWLPAALLLVACTDTTPPRFAHDAALALEPSADRIEARWPEASDDRAVSAYVLRVDGEVVARLGPEVRTYTLAGLPERAARALTVVALDAADNASPALECAATTLDATAPTFPATAALTLSAGGALGDATRALELSWTAAEDAGGVARYRVLSGEAEVGTTSETHLSLPAVALAETTAFSIVALDGADNASSPLTATWGSARQARDELVRARLEEQVDLVDRLLLGSLAGAGLEAVLAGGGVDPARDALIEDAIANAPGVAQHGGGGGQIGTAEGLGGISPPSRSTERP